MRRYIVVIGPDGVRDVVKGGAQWINAKPKYIPVLHGERSAEEMYYYTTAEDELSAAAQALTMLDQAKKEKVNG